MTTAIDVLAVEVSEGTDELAARLAALELPVRREDRLLLVPLDDDQTYDLILTAVAELDLPLHRLDQRRHRVAELFADPGDDQCPRLTTNRRRRRHPRHRLPAVRRARGSAGGTSFGALYVHGLRTAFGLGRSAKAKIFPWLIVGIVGVVAVVLTAIRAQTGEVALSYAQFPQTLSVADHLLRARSSRRSWSPGTCSTGCCRSTSPARCDRPTTRSPSWPP